MKGIFDDTFKNIILLLFVLGLFTLGSGSAMDISWNGTVWAVLDNENGSYLTLVTSDGHVSEIPLRVNGTPCGLAWNGSQWIVETFIPDRVEIQTLNGSVLFRIHSYDCKGFAYLNGTYYVPISESAMMGDCSLVQVSGEGKIKGTAPCGFINGVKVKVVEGRIYLMNCTGIYVYSDGRFEQVQRLENCTSDFDFLKDKTLLCSIGLIEHSKNTTRKILSSCDAIGCSGRECLVAANGTLYTYDGSLKTLEIENHANHSGSTLKKALSLGALLALLVGLFLCRRRPF